MDYLVALLLPGPFLPLNVASVVVGGHPLFWPVWALNLVHTLHFLRNSARQLSAAASRL